MLIDWIEFTPWSAAVGGAFIGAAAVTFATVAGRIAGISGIVAGVLRPRIGDIAWRIAFITGLIAVPLFFAWSGVDLPVEVEASGGVLAVAGLLAGFGSRLGSGCTSGHGVCGLARRSPRSFAATASFMAAGFATVFVLRHVLR